MKVLVLGGTRFFGVHMVNELLKRGHDVTIATRGRAKDNFGDSVKRITVDRMNRESLKNALNGKTYDAICDNIAFSSNDVKNLLDFVDTKRYVLASSASVYGDNIYVNVPETDFDPFSYKLKWFNWGEYDYNESKKQAECAAFQAFPDIKTVAVRFTYVIGEDDYTKRLFFYPEHVIKEIPMNIDNYDAKICFVDSKDAGLLLAHLAENGFTGGLNGGCEGGISVGEIIEYVQSKTGKKAVITQSGETAPYNGNPEYGLSMDRLKEAGFVPKPLKDWIYKLLDCYIEKINN